MKTLEKINITPTDDDVPQDPKPVRSRALAAHKTDVTHLPTPMELLNRAVSQGADIAILKELMGLQERHDANQARKAFDNAIAEAKASIPVIVKNRTVSYEGKNGKVGTSYKHEDLAEIARTITPILAASGLSYRYRVTSNVNEPVTVTCIVSHRDGHFEETTLSAGRDDSGSKNSIQAIGSTLTYLQRMTLKAALGLAAAHDDDAQTAEPDDNVSSDQILELQDLIAEVSADQPKLMAYFKIERLPDMKAADFDRAMKLLNAKRKA